MAVDGIPMPARMRELQARIDELKSISRKYFVRSHDRRYTNRALAEKARLDAAYVGQLINVRRIEPASTIAVAKAMITIAGPSLRANGIDFRMAEQLFRRIEALVEPAKAELAVLQKREHRNRAELAIGPSAPATPRPRQLPHDTAGFTGRTGELEKLLATTCRRRGRAAVVITAIDGMAGVGKTALAVHAAHRVAGRFPDGQFFVDLHGFSEGVSQSEPTDVLQGFLRDLGVADDRIPFGLDDRARLWRTVTAGQRMLILLDNAAAEEQVQPLLPGSASCLVMVTSRRRLAALDATHVLPLDILPPQEAVSLLLRAVDRDDLTDESPDLLAETVELCGRLPLAIRIVAARLRNRRAWTLSDMLTRLRDADRRLAELDDGRRSVNAALELSYHHLPTKAQRFYWLLGLHPGPDFDRYTTAALAGTTPNEGARLLDVLLDYHLLQEPSVDRYAFHDLVRDHASACAANTETASQQRTSLTQLLDYYRSTAAAAMDLVYPYERHRRPIVSPAGLPLPDLPDRNVARQWLDTELANLLAAARFAASHGYCEQLWQLPTVIHRHLRSLGRYRDAETLHHHALMAARDAGNRQAELHALLGLGAMHRLLDQFDLAAERFNQALNIARAINSRVDELEALLGLGDTRWMHGHHADATTLLRNALRTARAIHDPVGEMEGLHRLGFVCMSRGRFAVAAGHFRQALQIAKVTGNQAGELEARIGLASASMSLGQHEPALDQLTHALQTARTIGNRVAEMHALNGIGTLHRKAGRYQEAVRCLEQALDIARTTDNRGGGLNVVINLATLHLWRGDYTSAESHFRQGHAIALEIGDRNWLYEALQGLGRYYHATGRPELALSHHSQALELALELAQRSDQARALDGIAYAHQELGRHKLASRHWQRAHSILTSLGIDSADDLQTNTHVIRMQLAKLDG